MIHDDDVGTLALGALIGVVLFALLDFACWDGGRSRCRELQREAAASKLTETADWLKASCP